MNGTIYEYRRPAFSSCERCEYKTKIDLNKLDSNLISDDHDLAICIHVLEHLSNLHQFMEVMSLKFRRLIIEVPSAELLLDSEMTEKVIYAPHAQYFTPTSISYLSRLHRYRVTRLEQCFSDGLPRLLVVLENAKSDTSFTLKDSVSDRNRRLEKIRVMIIQFQLLYIHGIGDEFFDLVDERIVDKIQSGEFILVDNKLAGKFLFDCQIHSINNLPDSDAPIFFASSVKHTIEEIRKAYAADGRFTSFLDMRD